MTIPTIVTLDQAKAHAKQPANSGDGSPSMIDADLQLKLDAATEQVVRYIADRQPADDDWIAEIESWTATGSPPTLAPPLIRLAVMVLYADSVRSLGDDAPDGREPGFMNIYARNLLTQYRSPSLA